MHNSNDPNLKQYLSIPQYAKKLDISRIAVYKKVKNGQLPAKKIGRHYVVLIHVDEAGTSHPQPAQKIIQEKQLSVAEIAKKLNISRFTVHQRIRNGKINAQKVGRNFIVSSQMPLQKAPIKKQQLISNVNKLSSITQLSNQMAVTRDKVYKKIKAGQISAEKIGRNYVLPTQKIYTDLSKRKIKTQQLAKDYLSIPQLAQKLGVSRIAVYKKVKKGTIKGFKVGRNFVVPKGNVGTLHCNVRKP